jgi:hypothetical protein
LSIPRTFTFRNSSRKPARLTFAVAGTTVAAAGLVAAGLATATPGRPGTTAALGAVLAAHSSSDALPLTGISLDHVARGADRAAGSASLLAGGVSPVTATGRAILASGQAASRASAGAGKSSPAARSASQAPALHPAKSAARHKAAGQHASGGRPAHHAQLARAAKKVHHAAPAHHASARHTGPCASSTLHWWICSAEHALEQHGVSRSLLSTSAADIVVQHESGANPHAYNGWDSNAAAGHPSEGIAQVIGPTFQAYALPGHHNIWNPVDNMIAAFRYAISRYGSMNNIPGVVAVRQGGSYMGY